MSVASGTVGAGLALTGAWVSARHRERAAAREEWGRRFVAALSEISDATDERRRSFRQLILRSLAEDHRGSLADRRLADSVLTREVAETQATRLRPTDLDNRDKRGDTSSTGIEGGTA